MFFSFEMVVLREILHRSQFLILIGLIEKSERDCIVDCRRNGLAANVFRTRDLVEQLTPMLSQTNEHCGRKY